MALCGALRSGEATASPPTYYRTRAQSHWRHPSRVRRTCIARTHLLCITFLDLSSRGRLYIAGGPEAAAQLSTPLRSSGFLEPNRTPNTSVPRHHCRFAREPSTHRTTRVQTTAGEQHAREWRCIKITRTRYRMSSQLATGVVS